VDNKPCGVQALKSYLSNTKVVVIAADEAKARQFTFKYFGITEKSFESQVYPICIFDPKEYYLKYILSSEKSYTTGKLNLEVLEGCGELRNKIVRFCEPGTAIAVIDQALCHYKAKFFDMHVVTQYNFMIPSSACELEDKVRFVKFAAEANLPKYYHCFPPKEFNSNIGSVEACFAHTSKIVTCTSGFSHNGQGLKLITSMSALKAYCHYLSFEGCSAIRIMPYFAGSSLEADIVVLENEIVILPPFLSIFLLEKVSEHVYHFVDCGCENRRTFSDCEILGVHKVCHQVGDALQKRGYRGFANLNGVLHGDELVLTEINPRPPNWHGQYFENMNIIDACIRGMSAGGQQNFFKQFHEDLVELSNIPYVSCILRWQDHNQVKCLVPSAIPLVCVDMETYEFTTFTWGEKMIPDVIVDKAAWGVDLNFRFSWPFMLSLPHNKGLEDVVAGIYRCACAIFGSNACAMGSPHEV